MSKAAQRALTGSVLLNACLSDAVSTEAADWGWPSPAASVVIISTQTYQLSLGKQ